MKRESLKIFGLGLWQVSPKVRSLLYDIYTTHIQDMYDTELYMSHTLVV